MNLEELQKKHDAGDKMKYLLFWGHQKSADGSVTKSCFSQWWQADFVIDGITYPTAEHWMMAEKARLFKDKERLDLIVKSKSPAEAKKWGRAIVGFDQHIWESKRMEIVVEGNYHKFIQNTDLCEFLLNTKERIIVEASPRDRIWGIGMGQNNEFATIPTKWRGKNLLGFALMEVRDKILNKDKP